MRDDDITAPPEPNPNEDPKDVTIRNLRAKVECLERRIRAMNTDESWRTNPDRMGQ